jgi:hypothetical protein
MQAIDLITGEILERHRVHLSPTMTDGISRPHPLSHSEMSRHGTMVTVTTRIPPPHARIAALRSTPSAGVPLMLFLNIPRTVVSLMDRSRVGVERATVVRYSIYLGER